MGDAPHPPRSPLIPYSAVGLFTAFAIVWAVAQNDFPDFFIYRTGAELGLRGESPYDAARIRAAVAAQFPDADALIENCGFFLPPLAIVVFAPFALLPYAVAKVAWAVVNGLAAAGVLLLPRLFNRPREEIDRLWLAVAIVPFAVLLSPTLTVPVVIVGQTTLVFVGCVAAGQWCFDRGRPVLGALLWAVPFVKPHLALPLLPLAWYLGGWKRAAAVAGAVGGLTLLGCLIAGGSPLFIREYLDFLASGHKAVAFNRVELNPQVTSWNRLLFAAGGPLIELSAITTLAGYLVWGGLVLGRCALKGERPSPAWALAAAVVGAVLCSQVLGYEALVLALVVPWLFDLLSTGRHSWAAAVVALLALQWVPYPQYLEWIESLSTGPWEGLLLSYRAVGVAGLAVVVLVAPMPDRSPLAV